MYLVILLSLVFAGCGNERKVTGEETIKTEESQFRDIKCSIIVNKTSFFKNDVIPVTVKIENASNGKVEIGTIPAFVLAGLWAPVDIKVGQALPANTKMTLSLEKGETLSSNIDISKLGWDQSTSSIWPARNLFSIVSSGKYKLFLDLEINVDNGLYRVRSNEVEVSINK